MKITTNIYSKDGYFVAEIGLLDQCLRYSSRAEIRDKDIDKLNVRISEITKKLESSL